MSDSDTPDPRDERVLLEAESTEAFVERRRFQDLFAARQQVLDRLRQRPAALAGSRTSPAELDEDLHAAVKAYVLETEWLFKNAEFGQELWEERIFGPMPLSWALPAAGDGTQVLDINEQSFPGPVEIADDYFRLVGVRGYAALSTTQVEVKVRRELNRRGHAIEESTTRLSFTPPQSLSESVFQVTDELLADLGILGKLGGDDYHADEPGA